MRWPGPLPPPPPPRPSDAAIAAAREAARIACAVGGWEHPTATAALTAAYACVAAESEEAIIAACGSGPSAGGRTESRALAPRLEWQAIAVKRSIAC